MDENLNTQSLKVPAASVSIDELIQRLLEQINGQHYIIEEQRCLIKEQRSEIDKLANTVATQKELIQELRDEIAILKGQKPKPKISPSTLEVKDALAKLTAYGEVSQVTLAKIPAGEPVRFLYGRASPKIDPLTGEKRIGGGVQYRFYDFDPNWIKQTRNLQ